MTETSEGTPRKLLHWLHQHYPDAPLKRVKEWFAAGRVTLEGKVVRTFHLECPNPGNALVLAAPDKTPNQARGRRPSDEVLSIRDTRLRLVFADDDIAVVDKAAGLLSVPSEGVKAASAQSILKDELARKVYPVHRLDRFTSGLLCFAFNETAREGLIEALRAGQMDRGYIAFVEGAPEETSGTWRNFLELDPTGDQHLARSGSPTATEAVTHFYRSETYQRGPIALFSKLKLTLETGLKHQIRLQAAAAGLPLLGDRGYHTKYMENDRPMHIPIERQALHAWSLKLPHPESGELLEFESPLAQDLVRLQWWLRGADHPQARSKTKPRPVKDW